MKAIVKGKGKGKVLKLQNFSVSADRKFSINDLDEVLADLLIEFEEKLEKEEIYWLRNVYEFFISFLRDEEFLKKLRDKFSKRPIISSIDLAIKEWLLILSASVDPFFKERIADLVVIGNLIKERLVKKHYNLDNEDLIVVGNNVNIDIFLKIDYRRIKAICSYEGNDRTHMAIVAKALNIPYVIGVSPSEFEEGEIIIVDADNLRFYRETDTACLLMDTTNIVAGKTFDFIETRLNVIGAENFKELSLLSKKVGLFRTEYLYLLNMAAWYKQFEIYKQACENFDFVTFRLADIADTTNQTFRGIRRWLKEDSIRKPQLKAFKALIEEGITNFRIMIPFWTYLEELEETKKILKRNEINVDLGVMIEVPISVYLGIKYIDKIDFFALGTNDLFSYYYAIDREKDDKFIELDENLWELLETLISYAKEKGKEIGVCGEIAGKFEGILIAKLLKLDYISVESQFFNEIENIKEKLADFTLKDYSNIKDLVRELSRR